MDEPFSLEENFTNQDFEFPSVMVYENREGYLLRANVPEYDEADVEAAFEGGVLRLSGWKYASTCNHNLRILFSDFPEEEGFRRTFRFPVAVQTESMKIRFEEGVLMVWLPKA